MFLSPITTMPTLGLFSSEDRLVLKNRLNHFATGTSMGRQIVLFLYPVTSYMTSGIILAFPASSGTLIKRCPVVMSGNGRLIAHRMTFQSLDVVQWVTSGYQVIK